MNVQPKFKGWYVDWIKITLSTGVMFYCPVDGWLDNYKNPAGPPSRTVICTNSGDFLAQAILHSFHVLKS